MSNNLGWSNLGVGSNDSGGLGHLGADLLALGGDHLLAVLDGGDVHHSLAHSLGHLPAGGDWHLVTLLHWDRLTERSGDSSRSSVSIVTSISLSLGSGFSLSISFSLTIDSSRVSRDYTRSSSNSNRSSGSNTSSNNLR